MKILHINSGDLGGAGNSCIRLHKGLLKENINSKLLILNQHSNDIPEVYPIYKTKTKLLMKKTQNAIVNQRNRKITKLSKNNFSFPHSTHRIERHELVEWADVINLHWVSGLINYSSFFTSLKKPIVWTMHDMNPFSGGYHYLKGVPQGAYQKHARKNERVKSKKIKKANLNIVAPSMWLHDLSKASNVFGELSHNLIPYGIDTSIFKPTDKTVARNIFGIDLDKKVLVFIAHSVVNERKGAANLLKAIKKLNDPNVILMMVGNNINMMVNHSNVVKIGKISDERLMALALSAADIFVIPSIEDNLPNTVIESITCGTPAIGFNIGGIPDMIIEGKNGLICDEINVCKLKETIEKGLNMTFDKDWIREDAVKRFDQSVQATRYIELYDNLI